MTPVHGDKRKQTRIDRLVPVRRLSRRGIVLADDDGAGAAASFTTAELGAVKPLLRMNSSRVRSRSSPRAGVRVKRVLLTLKTSFEGVEAKEGGREKPLTSLVG